MKPLNQTSTGGFSFLKGLFLVAGAAFVAMQVLVFLSWSASTEASLFSKLAPGLAALLSIAYAVFFLGKTGHSKVSGARLEGKTASGRVYGLDLSAIGSVDLESRLFALKDDSGKVMLLDRPCENSLFPGYVALRLAYPELPDSFWEQVSALDQPEKHPCIRYFMDTQGNPAFFDVGFRLECGPEMLYMPTHDTLPATRGLRNDNRPSTISSGSTPILKFNPDPSKLPSYPFLTTLASQNPEKALEFVMGHGGCTLKPQPDHWTGEVGGYAVQVEG
jgi:hypothetical protein